MSIKNQINNPADWREFASNYLTLCLLACSEIKDKKYKDSFQIEYSMYIPAIFNLKHGIEILLKALSIQFLEKEALEKSDYSHDLEELFINLHKHIPKKRQEEAQKKFNEGKKDSELKFGDKPILDELEFFVKKYQNLDFLKSKLTPEDFIIKDSDNTAFKYPTNNLSVQINYVKLCKKITEEDITALGIDAALLETLLWKIAILIKIDKK